MFCFATAKYTFMENSGAPVLLFQLLLVPIYIKNKKHYLHILEIANEKHTQFA